jgi:hypothetical protein
MEATMTDKPEFMVLVDGQPAPRELHPHCPAAMFEAECLAKLPVNRGLTIRVVKVVQALEPVHQWRNHQRPETL